MESKASFCPTELDVSFSRWALGKCSSESSLRVSDGKGVCAVYPADESPDHVRIVLGEAMELEDPEKNEIMIGRF